MERRRLVLVVAGLVVVGGAVVALRLTGGPPNPSALPPAPPPPTVVRAYHAEGVVLPEPGGRPAAPGRLALVGGPRRLMVSWGSALPDGHDPAGAVGYDVRWGTGAQLDHSKLVAVPEAELDGLDDTADTHVEVRSVDAFGRRSGPATATGRAKGVPRIGSGGDNSFLDVFTGAQVPDPRLWRLAAVDGCASARRGTGEHAAQLLVVADCTTGDTTALRSRVPFVLSAAPAGELGRFSIDTDAPGEDGELDLTLVPGPVDLVAGSPADLLAPAAPNVATVDADLPPGTVRVRILTGTTTTTAVTTGPESLVDVTVGPGTPLVAPVDRKATPLPVVRPGVSVRWDVVLRTDGIRVLRDGVDVGGGNAVPAWSRATALVEFGAAGVGQLQAHVSMIGFGGAPTGPVPLADGPTAAPRAGVGSASAAGAVELAPAAGAPSAGELRLTVVPQSGQNAIVPADTPPAFFVDVGGRRYPARPAVPGTAFVDEARYPLVATLPAAALAEAGPTMVIGVTAVAPMARPVLAAVVAGDLEVDPPAKSAVPLAEGATQPTVDALPPGLAMLNARLLDAGGLPVPLNQPLPRGRLVLDVSLDAEVAQRTEGSCAGVSGLMAWLDGVRIAAVPTAVDGPGVAGRFQIAFIASDIAPGAHVLTVHAYGTDAAQLPDETFVDFQLAGP